MMRLDRFLSDAGVGTRKHCKKAIRSGVVTIGGIVCKDEGHNFDPSLTEVAMNGKKVEFYEEVYLLLNKPENYMCSTIDEMYPSVLNLIDDKYVKKARIVGRLDADTTGVLLLTSNGKLNNRLIHPNLAIEKEYEVKLNHQIDEEKVKEIMKAPIQLDEETSVQPKRISIVDEETVRIVVTEGKYHEIKRIFHRFGFDVMHLDRIRLGTLTYGNLKRGEYRELTEEEVEKLREITNTYPRED
jgi:16S rRNA pseudouridine516 synthase